MFESIDEEMKKDEGTKSLRERILEYTLVGIVTLTILAVAYIAIVYLG